MLCGRRQPGPDLKDQREASVRSAETLSHRWSVSTTMRFWNEDKHKEKSMNLDGPKARM